MKKTYKNDQTIVLLCVIIFLISALQPMQTFGASQEQFVFAENINSGVVEQLDNVDFVSLQSELDDFISKNTNYFTIDNVKSKVYSIIAGEEALNYSSFFASLFGNVLQNIIKYLPFMSVVVAIGVMGNLLNGLKSKFNEKSTADLIGFVSLFAVVSIVVSIISSLQKSTSNSINTMISFTNGIFPIMLTLLVALGASTSVGVFQPAVAIMSTYVMDFFNYFILPLFLLSFIFGVLSNISNGVKLDKFSAFISSLFKWSVGVIFTIFFAFLTIQGITAGSFDNIGIRTTKFTIKSYVPIMGGYISDGMDIILTSTVLIKNSVGIVGVLLVAGAILAPLVEIIVCSLVLKLISAVVQPLEDGRISNFLSSTAKSVTILSTCVIAIGFMFLLSIGILMSTANMVVL